MTTQLRPYQQAVIDQMRNLHERFFVTPKTSSQIDDSALPLVTDAGRINMGISFWEQHYGRALRGRLVHAQRARKLRRRGELVRFAGYTSTGQIKYRWMKQPHIIDFKHDPANAGTNQAQLDAYNWVLGERNSSA